MTVVDFVIGEERFEWSGSTLVSPGYTAVYTWQALQSDDTPTVSFEKGQVWSVEQVSTVVLSSSQQLLSVEPYTPNSVLTLFLFFFS